MPDSDAGGDAETRLPRAFENAPLVRPREILVRVRRFSPPRLTVCLSAMAGGVGVPIPSRHGVFSLHGYLSDAELYSVIHDWMMNWSLTFLRAEMNCHVTFRCRRGGDFG